MNKIKALLEALRRRFAGRYLANTQMGAGEHGNGCITKLSAAASTVAHCVVKIGDDVNHVAASAATSDIPLGICDAEPDAAEEYVRVKLFGNYPGTMIATAGAAIALGAMLQSAGDGRVVTLITTTGSWYIIGRALNAADAANETVEVQHCFPTLRTVA